MSCGNEPEAGTSEDGPSLMPRRRPLRRVDRSICQRCRTSKSQFIMRSNTQCRECYLLSINTNFLRVLYPPLRPATASKSTKQAIQTRPPIQPGAVLVALSGGCGSSAMLDMLLSGGYIGNGDGRRADKTKGEKDVVWDRGYVVYVEFAAVTGMPDTMEEMRKSIAALDTRLVFVGLRAEDAFDESLLERLGGGKQAERTGVNLARTDLPMLSPSESSSKSPLEQLHSFITALPPASRPSALTQILTHLINIATSSVSDVSHVLLGETSTREAQRVISGTAMGRGWALPLELAPSRSIGEERWTQMKPMKEITVKDAAIYCHLKGVETVNHRNWGGGVGNGKTKATTIEALTEQFIAGLSVTHPSTVSTINKTGDKLMFTGDENGKRCPFCDEPVDPSALEWKSRTALTSLPDKDVPSEAANHPPDGMDRSLAPLLCYACLTTLTPTSTKRQETEETAMPIWMEKYLIPA